MSRRGFRLSAWTGMMGLALVFVSLSASAYQTITMDNGDVVRWKGSCYYYTLHEDGAPGIKFSDLEEAIRASFAQWTDLECSYFYVKETKPASCVEIGFNEEGGNMNLLVWQHDQWPHNEPNAMALTTLSYDHKTGEILDADIEFNAYNFVFGLDGSISKADLRNTASHEIGHTLGLDHSTDPNATMYGMAMPGETNKRTISEDDEKGVCSLYPVQDDPETCDEPICGLNLTCKPNDCSAQSKGKSKGCVASEVGAPAGWSLLALFPLDILRALF